MTDATADTDLIDRLARLDTGQVSDVMDEAGLPNQALSSLLLPLAPGQRFAGRAACVRGAPAVETRVPVPSLSPNVLDEVIFDGSVLLIDAGGFRGGAVLGGLVAFSLQRSGCRAIVTDGCVRDADEIRALGLPVHATGVTPVNGWRRWRILAADVPVAMPGQSGSVVLVTPGDLVLGDGDGVLVVPRAHALSIVEDAEQLARIEASIDRELKAGGSRADVFSRHPRFAHVRPVHATEA